MRKLRRIYKPASTPAVRTRSPVTIATAEDPEAIPQESPRVVDRVNCFELSKWIRRKRGKV